MMNRNINQALLALTEGDKGIAEWPGAANNPAIVAMGVPDDETPWCCAYINSRLGALGIQHPGRLNARSYLNWGAKVPLDRAVPGDIVVFWRGSRSSWQGHVAIFVERKGDQIIVRGGNQGNTVSDKPYPISKVLGVRRWDGTETVDGKRPTLRMGNTASDPFVKVAQQLMASRGYFSGAQDGLFGPRTRASVLAFQADNNLDADGVIGEDTWAALTHTGENRDGRKVTSKKLAARGSRTVKDAKRGKRAAEGLTGVGAVTWWLGNGASVTPALESAEGALERGQALLHLYWPIMGVLALGAAAWWLFNRFERYRLEDARSGANDKL